MASRSTIYLVIEDANQQVNVLELTEGRNIIGLSPASQVVLQGANIARLHAALIIEGGLDHPLLKLEHLAEGAATLFMPAGQFVLLQTRGQSEKLHEGETFCIGNYKFIPFFSLEKANEYAWRLINSNPALTGGGFFSPRSLPKETSGGYFSLPQDSHMDDSSDEMSIGSGIDDFPAAGDQQALDEMHFGAVDSGTPSAEEKRVGVWLSEHPEGVTQPLILEQTYTLNFKVGLPVSGTLAAGSETIIQQSDIPYKGLDTEWEVISQTLRLATTSTDTRIETKTLGGKTIWTARFPLAIPKQGESATVQFQATPAQVGEAGLDILVYVRGEVYRQLAVRLSAAEPEEEVTAHAPQPILTANAVHAAAEHLNIRPAYEWQTPPGELNISVIGNGLAFVTGETGGHTVGEATQWFAAPAKIAGSIVNVSDALERFRMKWEKYLNDIDPADLARRLENPPRPYDWENPETPEAADAASQQAWEQAAVSAELRNLAYAGHTLFEEIFPRGEELRGWIDSLPPGHRINIFWQETAGADYVAHIPWGLLYLPDPPDPGSPVDAMGFWGLRFRTEYRAYAVPGGSKALGGPQTAHCTFALYWGEGDEVGTESIWQRQEWLRYRNQNLIPVGAVRKMEILTAFSRPQPEPTAVVYFFCHCSVGEGNNPVLRFGSTKAEEDNIRRTDFSVKPLNSNPLIFANACTTSTADAYMANDLEQSFFRRGCRAFVGTEAKVPITLASRFASIFFRYFLREIAPEPMAGGEAMAQTRLFLWNQYRNIGGLFYTYINQYELYFADDAEVKKYRL